MLRVYQDSILKPSTGTIFAKKKGGGLFQLCVKPVKYPKNARTQYFLNFENISMNTLLVQ